MKFKEKYLALVGIVALACVGSANAATTYNVTSTHVGIIGANLNPGNDPSPENLACIAAADTCLAQSGGSLIQAGNYTGSETFETIALWKSGEGEINSSGVTADYTGLGTASGTVTVTWNTGELFTSYLAVKAANGYELFKVTYDAMVNFLDGDKYVISWSLLGSNASSHLSLYDTSVPNRQEVPLPGAAVLLFSGLLGLGALGRLRSRKASVIG